MYSDEYLKKLQEKVRRLEFDKLPHEVAIKFIEEAIEMSSKLKMQLKKAESEVKNILKELVDADDICRTKLNDDEALELSSLPSAGIDGSNRVKGGKLGMYYIMLVAGISKFLDGVYNKCGVEFSDIKVQEYVDPSGEKSTLLQKI